MPHSVHVDASETLRRRKPQSERRDDESKADTHDLKKQIRVKPRRSSWLEFFALTFALSLAILFIGAAYVTWKRSLLQDRQGNGSPLSPFVTGNAMKHIRTIAAKPRYVSSLALEDSLQYIYSAVDDLKSTAGKNDMHIDLEMFRSDTGSFATSIGTIYLINSYDKMSSVVARIRPLDVPYNSSEKALLINAHVDSAIGAPGANDNVAGVAVVLELMRCIAEQQKSVNFLSRPIVFLFNGGEEVVLPAAHSFITQHPWAKSLVAHINMESIGSGDSYHLFRLGPGSPWLAKAYANAVSSPSASVVATDVFNSGIIPAETDFRIFDEIGHLPGYDFVLLDNGYIYHTTYDCVEKVNDMGISHGGDTVYQLTMELAGRNDAIGQHLVGKKPTTPQGRLMEAFRKISLRLNLVKDPSYPNVTFFDILNVVTIVYEEGVATLINLSVLFFLALTWMAKFADAHRRDTLASIRMSFVLIGGILASFASSTFASLIYSEVLRVKLRWYGTWLTAVFMYLPPALFGLVSAMLLFLPRNLSANRFDHMLLPVTLVYAFISLACTRFGIMSSYMSIYPLLMTGICALQGSRVHPVLKHAELMVVHALIGTKLLVTSFATILPLLGRIRSTSVPHDTIAALVVTFQCHVHVLLSSFPILCYYARCLRRLRAAVFFVSLIVGVYLVLVAPKVTGKSPRFTYSTDAPKRISAIHFYSPQQEPEAVLWLGSQDPVQLDQQRILERLSTSDFEVVFLPSTPYWGKMQSSALESFRPFGVFFQEVVVVKSRGRPHIPLPTASVLAEEHVRGGWNVTFLVEALDSHVLTVRFPTNSNSSLKGWSLNADIPRVEEGAWIKHTGSPQFRFWLLLEEDRAAPAVRPRIPMAVTGGRLGFSRSPSDLEQLSFEEWEAPAVAVSSGIEVIL